MTITAPTEPPDYPHCGRGADAQDPVGCRGIRVPCPQPTGDEVEIGPYEECLAHLDDNDRHAYLASLSPGSDIDHRGTTFNASLLQALLGALRDSAGLPTLGTVNFDLAAFEDDAVFDEVTFQGEARFDGTTFKCEASFIGAEFKSPAWFTEADFLGGAQFVLVTFEDLAWFQAATFHKDATFKGAKFEEAAFHMAVFHDTAVFTGVRFAAGTWFGGTLFQNDAYFVGATFERASILGPLVCQAVVSLSEATFSSVVTLEIAASTVKCQRTHWAAAAALRMRHAAVDLSDAVLEFPVSLTDHKARPFTWGEEAVEEPGLVHSPVRILSLRGVDASHLVLADVDLSNCRFAGTVNLDQLRLHGRCTLAPAPAGFYRRGPLPVRCTPRQTLAEEHYWRAARRQAEEGWAADPEGAAPLEPSVLTPVYRELRKGFEDAKNEPGAVDFYYGEMEMRRHDPHAPGAERLLLWLYWAVSGYGLRASRALCWLLGAMSVTVLLMMLWGLPQHSPKPTSTGTLDGRRITMTTDTPSPVNPRGPLLERLSGDRFEPAVRVVIKSTVFRSSGKELTTFGTYAEMASRFTEPVLLALALLAIRNRVKR